MDTGIELTTFVLLPLFPLLAKPSSFGPVSCPHSLFPGLLQLLHHPAETAGLEALVVGRRRSQGHDVVRLV